MAEGHPYLTLKLAHEFYRKPPESLDAAERRRVDSVVARQLEIEQRILATAEAAQVVLPTSSVAQGVGEVRGRYASDEEFAADLERSGLTPASLRAAIERDLKVEAVLERAASRATAVSDTDVEIFYLMNRARFTRPERRSLRHILVTINDSLPGNTRAAALARIEAIRERLLKSPERFAEQACKHSECPTAMNGGLLGAVTRGQLYPELEPAAFALAPAAMSDVLESPMGFHLLLCESIEAAGELTLAEVRVKVRGIIEESRRRAARQEWLAVLLRGAAQAGMARPR